MNKPHINDLMLLNDCLTHQSPTSLFLSSNDRAGTAAMRWVPKSRLYLIQPDKHCLKEGKISRHAISECVL